MKEKEEKTSRALLARTKHELSYALSLLEPNYFDFVADELKEGIEQKVLVNIYKLNKILASYAISLGWTPKGLIDLLGSTLLTEDKEGFDASWGRFIAILAKDDKYRVYIHISTKTVKSGEIAEQLGLLKHLGIKVVSYEEIVQANPNIRVEKIPAKREKRYLLFDIQAKDVYAAARAAVQHLNTKITVLAFYNKISAWSLNDGDGFVIAEIRGYIKTFKSSDIYNTNMEFQAESKIFQNVITMFANDRFMQSTIGNALIGVYNYTNISSISVFPEERFMNLWIALESVMRTGQYPNIIAHIKEVLPAIMCKRYIYRVVRNFAEDCNRCNVNLDLGKIVIDVADFRESKEEMVEKMISVLRDAELRTQLESRCTVNSLLLYRLSEVAELLKDNTSVILRLRRYHRTVSWHTQRLYRIRNEIAHSALQENNNIVILTEHLYDYLAVLISEIIYASSEKHWDDINTIYPFLKDNYDAFDSVYTPQKKLLTERFMLKKGIIEYLDNVERQENLT